MKGQIEEKLKKQKNPNPFYLLEQQQMHKAR
jgi:hypothetical protein